MSIKTTYTQCDRKIHDNYSIGTFRHNRKAHGTDMAWADDWAQTKRDVRTIADRFHSLPVYARHAMVTTHFAGATALLAQRMDLPDMAIAMSGIFGGAIANSVYTFADLWTVERTVQRTETENLPNVFQFPRKSA